MPRLDESSEQLLQVGHHVERRARRVWNDFVGFAFSDNVLHVAVGLIIAAAFTTVVTSFVSDILLPPLSLLPFINRNMEEKFAVLRHGKNYTRLHGYNTLKQARDDGAVVMAYGSFLNKLINFLGVGLALFFIASSYEYLSRDSIITRTVKCKYCRKTISAVAMRCINCTSWQDGREGRGHTEGRDDG